MNPRNHQTTLHRGVVEPAVMKPKSMVDLRNEGAASSYQTISDTGL